MHRRDLHFIRCSDRRYVDERYFGHSHCRLCYRYCNGSSGRDLNNNLYITIWLPGICYGNNQSVTFGHYGSHDSMYRRDNDTERWYNRRGVDIRYIVYSNNSRRWWIGCCDGPPGRISDDNLFGIFYRLLYNHERTGKPCSGSYRRQADGMRWCHYHVK